jgi:predicted PurR-regulated permease PerM
MIQTMLQRRTFLLLLAGISIGFALILLPFYGAIFWGIILAILFSPVERRLLRRLGHRRNLAAFATVMLFLVLVFIPFTLITVALVEEGTSVYDKIRSGQIDFGAYLQQIFSSLPGWLSNLLSKFGVTDISSLKDALSSAATEGSQFIATNVINIGQITVGFVISVGIMLYLLFFLLRDGGTLTARLERAIPIDEQYKRQLLETFATVIRATIKGNIVVAIVQGTLGGCMFWFLGIPAALLWAVLMAILSLAPAIGSGLIWGPVALYFLFTGSFWQGITLVLFGTVVIGLVDNILRPILVGKDTQMPDYVVLISTLGGIAAVGLNGFVLGPIVAALFIAMWDLFIKANNRVPASAAAGSEGPGEGHAAE